MKFSQSFFPFDYLKISYHQNSWVWVFYAMGLIFSRGYIYREFCILSLILLLSVFTVKTPHQQYYMMFFPLMAIISGYGVVHLIKSNKAIMYIVIIASALPMFVFSRNLIANNNTDQIDKINYVLLNTTKDDYVYDGNIKFNIFRKDVDYFWFSVRPNGGALETYKTLSYYDYNIYESINKYKPKIISNYYIDINNELISKNYQPSHRYNDIFIRIE